MRTMTITGIAMLAWFFQAHAVAQPIDTERTLALLMSVEGESLRVVSARLSPRQPDRAPAPGEQGIAYELTDGGNTVLFRGRMVDATQSHLANRTDTRHCQSRSRSFSIGREDTTDRGRFSRANNRPDGGHAGHTDSIESKPRRGDFTTIQSRAPTRRTPWHGSWMIGHRHPRTPALIVRSRQLPRLSRERRRMRDRCVLAAEILFGTRARRIGAVDRRGRGRDPRIPRDAAAVRSDD